MRVLALATLVACFCAPASFAAAPPRRVASIEGITEYRLDNGLRVLLFPDASKATVTVNITYLVGSRQEGYGETGMAHLLEHMLFKGTPSHDKIMELLEQHGADYNGSTNEDRTNYYETLPSTPENLAFAIALEADRMIHSRIARADLDKELTVVRNELENDENDEAGILSERMHESAFVWHGYGRPTIGARSDIEHVPVAALEAFYRRWYQPDNAVLVIAGRFDEKAALALVGEQLGAIARPSRVLPAPYTVEPAQDGERTVMLRRAGDAPIFGLLYHGVPCAHPDFAAEQAIAAILTARPWGRLHHALIESGLAGELTANVDPMAEPGVFELTARLVAGAPVERARGKMIAIVEGLARTPVTALELRRFQARALRDFDLALMSSDKIGVELSEWAAAGDWRLLFLHRDRVKALTIADVQRVAAAYLVAANRTEGQFLPTDEPRRAPIVNQPDVTALVAGYHGGVAIAEGEAFEPTAAHLEERARRITLANGMKVALVQKKTRGASVSVSLSLHAGSADDWRGHLGAALLLPHVALRGSRRLDEQAVEDELDRLRATIEVPPGLAPTGDPTAQFAITTVRAALPEVLALAAELVERPALSARALEAVKSEQLALLDQIDQQATQRAQLALTARLMPYPVDDARRTPSIEELRARIRKVTRAELMQLHQNLWGGDAAELAIVGDFDTALVEQVLRKELGGWRAKKPWRHIARKPSTVPASDELVRMPDREGAAVGVGLGLPLRDDDVDYPALLLASHILGGGARSRISRRLREEEGLSYGAQSTLLGDDEDPESALVAIASCAPQNARRALALLVEEVTRLVVKGVDDSELAEAKQTYRLARRAELVQDELVAARLVEALHVGRTLAFDRDVDARVDALTSRELAAAIGRHLDPAKLVQVIAGDVK